MVPVAVIAAAPSAAEPLEPALDEFGRLRRPVVLIDTDTGRDELSPDQVAAAVRRIRASAALTVAVTATVRVLDPVAKAADLSLAGSPNGLDHPHPGTVGCGDPVAAGLGLIERAAHAPRAALALTWLLRGSAHRSVADGLAAESATYSMLLGSAEFAGWLAGRGPARSPGPPERVRMSRDGAELSITLARPWRRNAFDAAMRDALREALLTAEADPSARVTLSGLGPSFSAGGDLDEFGTAGDPAAAHLVRVLAGSAAVLHRVRHRVTVRLHGACIGAGIEIPAFADRVLARPDAVFALPEIGMGLIPGAGGTVSIPRRIGRARTLWLALSGHQLDPPTALAWGLIDSIEEPSG